MKIALKQQNLHQAEDWLKDVSSPTSPNFGKFWSHDEIIEAFQPPPESVENVLFWLESEGVERHKVTHSDNKQWLVFSATASMAESLFHTEYHEFHDIEGRSLTGTDRVHLPRSLMDSIDFVKPGALLQPLVSSRKQRRASAGPATPKKERLYEYVPDSDATPDCSKEVTPQCLSTLLNFPFPDSSTPTGQSSLGIYFRGDYYVQTSLDQYWEEFFHDRIPQGTGPDFVSIDGGVRISELQEWVGTNYGYEALLDLQQTIPFYYPNKVINIQVDDEYWAENRDHGLVTPLLEAIDGSYCTSCANGVCGPSVSGIDPIYPDNPPPDWADWALYKGTYQCGTFKPPAVIASSYYSSLGEHNAHTQAFTLRSCAEIMKLGLQGVTFLFSSGDYGVGDYFDNGDTCERFFYSYPNGCPWLTVVGGTMIGAGKTEKDLEVVWQTGPAGNQPWKDSLSSGSGFSNFFERPSYQKSVVDAYLASHDQGYPYYTGSNLDNSSKGYYNREGRAYPDFSTNAGPVRVFPLTKCYSQY
jgi:tripeptidyl-peptidase-1